jgi:hypothetical protein
MMILKTSRSNLSSNDQLSLDLPFAATKSLTARVGPTPTFTRGSGATYIGSDGLIHGVDTSTTSNTIGTGSRTFTLAATAGQDQLWRVGDAVEASNGSNFMVGTVTSYDAATQSLVCNMTSIGGSGTFTSWRIGYRGPRFDHTTAGDCRGLLIEESRTNLLQRSEDFGNATWTKANSSISGTLYTAPTGASTANELVEDSLNAAHTCVQNAATATIGTTYTFSVFVKRKPSSNQFLLIGATNLVVASFISVNLTNGGTSTGIGSPGSPINVSSTAYPDGWYRVQFSVVATSAASITLDIRLSRDGTWANRSYLGDGVQSSLLWGAQVEAGSFPTSYIPTTTGTLARSADVCNITGDDFSGFYNQSEGTLTVKVEEFRRGTSYNTVVEIFNGLSYSGNRLGVVFGGLRSGVTSPVEISLFSGGPAQYQTATTSTSSGYTAAIAYATDNVRGSLNGNLLAADTPPSNVNIGANTIRFGSIGIHIAAVRFYKKRLPNAKLQALTV